MKRLPLVFSFFLFLALSATLAYWIVQWTAPVPRAVSAPPKSERTTPPISAAASLFGGRSSGSATIANVQLRGVVHSGSLSDSVAIIAVEGKPPRALTLNSEIVPGVIVKQILNKTVVVSEKGAERELSLPAFAAQESNSTMPQASIPTAPNLPPANPSAALNTVNSTGASGSSSQGSGMTSPSPARPASQSQSGVAPIASEPARPLPSQ
ncbi:Type II secretion system protein GspC, N-terminal [Oxalobacteraceae bacterium]